MHTPSATVEILIVWTETMSALLDLIHALCVRACLESVWECACTCAQSESWSWADNTHPLLQGPDESNEKRTIVGPQRAKWTHGCQGVARQTKVAALPKLMHQADEWTAPMHIWWFYWVGIPEIDNNVSCSNNHLKILRKFRKLQAAEEIQKMLSLVSVYQL